MDEYQSLISIISLTLSVSWASVINLYAAAHARTGWRDGKRRSAHRT